MNCCDYGQCNRNSDCATRATTPATTTTPPPFQCCPMPKPAQKEIAGDLFFYVGFVFFVAVICAAAGLAWGLLVRFAPDFVHMLQYLFS